MSELVEPEKEKLFLLQQEEILVEGELTYVQKEMQKLRDQIDALRMRERDTQVKVVNTRTKINDQKRLIQRIHDDIQKELELKGEDEWMKELIAEILDLVDDFPSFKRARHYQYDDIIATIVAYKKDLSGMLNANDMGAGKTAETTMTMYILIKLFKQKYGREPNTLWLTKKSLVLSTPTEIRRWWPKLKIFTSPETSNISAREFALEMYESIGGIFMANYEFIRTTPKSKDIKWDFVVIDEAHKLAGGANPGGPTQVWVTCGEIARQARFNMMLTGTPMVNKPDQMWSYLNIFNPEKFPSMKQFRRDFCQYKNVAGIVEITVDPMKILNNALKGQMIRRSRAEFGIELPELTTELVMLQMGPKQRELYDQMRTRFFIWLDENSDKMLNASAIIAQLTRMRQINTWPAGIKVEYAVIDESSSPIVLGDELMTVTKAVNCKESIKIEEAMERIEMVVSIPSQIDDSISEQVLLFCTFNEPLREIQRRCDTLGIKCEVISGQTTSREKGRSLEAEFQRGEIQVLCLNSKMGEGLNLQKNPTEWIGGASYGICLDKWWTPMVQDQCLGRFHRPGSTVPVTWWIFENENSVDEFMNVIIEGKAESFRSIMDSDVVRPKSEWKKWLEELI